MSKYSLFARTTVYDRAMPDTDIQAIAKNCTKLLNRHRPRSVQQRLQRVADSPLSLERNDNYGNGGVVSELEREVAALLGKEDAVFMPSGIMAQLIAVRIWSDRAANKKIAFHPTSHLYLHEEMAYRDLHGLDEVLLGQPDSLFTLQDIEAMPDVSSVLIELPQREIGGQLPSWDELVAITDRVRKQGIKLHLDGARLWQCAPFYERDYAEISALFDSVYVSFYKVLDGFPGAILAGEKDFIDEARIWRRRHGGTLQQQSPAAISAKMGLQSELPKIPGFVARTKQIADELRVFPQLKLVPEYPQINMFHIHFQGDPEKLLKAAIQVAEEERAGLFFGLSKSGIYEYEICDGADDFAPGEVHRLFSRLFELAN
ncbi:aminotransferase class I/II-fold pyridoxal phosphate-dependent enzyme [soil metagenome]